MYIMAMGMAIIIMMTMMMTVIIIVQTDRNVETDRIVQNDRIVPADNRVFVQVIRVGQDRQWDVPPEGQEDVVDKLSRTMVH